MLFSHSRKSSQLARVSPNHARRRRLSSRRNASVLTILAASLPLIFLSCGMVIDLGLLQTMRAQAQRAADAAAIAAALAADGENNAGVVPEGKKYANLNAPKLSDGSPDTAFWTQVVITPNYQGDPNRVSALVTRRVNVYFAPVFEGLIKLFVPDAYDPTYSRDIETFAVAQRFAEAPIQFSTGGFYGIADPNVTPANQSVYGPYAYYNWGDPYSVKYKEDGTPNDEYNPEGFSYTLDASKFTSTDGKMQVQIYDPDTFSPFGNSYDEIRPPNSAIPNLNSEWGGEIATTTKFTLWDTNGTLDTKDDVFIADQTYVNDPATNEQWITPPGFDVNVNASAKKQFRLQVQAIDGSSENGYKLRAGPTEGLGLTDVEWNRLYGDNGNTNRDNVKIPITADDTIQMNFTQSGNTKLELGFVPKSLAGKEIQITKFDVDVGSESITYSSDGTSQTFAGTFPDQRNGTFSTDTIRLPSDFQGGMFYATYVAGANDTSNWRLSAIDTTGPTGKVRLTK